MSPVDSTKIIVISPIDTTYEGPIVPKGKKGWQPVHLQQGSMDGACGLYSLMMGLIICGVVSYDDARSYKVFSQTSKIGRLFGYFKKFDPLIKNGIDLDQMFTAIDEYCPGQIACQGLKSKGSELINFIEQQLIENRPVLLILTFEGGAHWVLVIGREYKYNRHGKKTSLCRFLILDPDLCTPLMCSWNGVIDVSNHKGKFPYDMWAFDKKIQLVYAIAIWPTEHK